MIFWIGILIFVSVIIFLLLCFIDKYDGFWGRVAIYFVILCVSFEVCFVFTVPIAYVGYKQHLYEFRKQSEYFEKHVATDIIEDAALTAKKVELNSWLYKAQRAKQTYGFTSIYTDEILELKPIE